MNVFHVTLRILAFPKLLTASTSERRRSANERVKLDLFKYVDLEAAASGGFVEENLIGISCHGELYEATVGNGKDSNSEEAVDTWTTVDGVVRVRIRESSGHSQKSL
jgi:hypothetical protein